MLRTQNWPIIGLLAILAGGCNGKTDSVTTLDESDSVRPGINDPFQDPEVEKWVGRFEVEAREIYRERARIIARADLKPGMVVADVGAGTGIFIPLLSETIGPEGEVLAVDIAQKFLDHIRKRADKLQLTNVRTVLSRQDSVALADESVDVMVICDTYHHFEYPRPMMRSIHEALKPGGRIVVIDFKREEGKSREWVLNHIRANQATVVDEISSFGFELTDDGADVDFLDENYIIQFRKVGG